MLLTAEPAHDPGVLVAGGALDLEVAGPGVQVVALARRVLPPAPAFHDLELKM